MPSPRFERTKKCDDRNMERGGDVQESSVDADREIHAAKQGIHVAN